MARYKTKLPPHQPKKSIRTWLIAAGAGVILMAVFVLLSSGGRDKVGIEVTGSPKIMVDQEAFDYGDVKLGGTPIRTVVRVTNVGDKTLKFTEAPYIEVLEGC